MWLDGLIVGIKRDILRGRNMKFRIKKDSDGWYFAEYKRLLCWHFVYDSYSQNIEKTKKVCKEFKNQKEDELIEEFEL